MKAVHRNYRVSEKVLTMSHPYARLFAYDHLPEDLQVVSSPFAKLATSLMYGPNANDPMINLALIKIWEAKNLAVLAAARKY